jgi:alpha,alpha-trehalase
MWDELFIFPFLSLRRPLLTRALLRYRYDRLPAARRMAREEGCRGALYPWQSGSSGREESQVIHLNPQSGNWIPDNSHRQRHINCAIAHNVWTYFEVTGDRDFLTSYGAEMLIEIARYFASRAVFNHERGRYEIRGVMGPDEFHTAYPDVDPTAEGGLDNNAYTNVMTAWLMNRARDALDIVAPDARRRLCETLVVTDDELGRWDEIATRLFVPFHDDGIISQFEGYGDLLEFDWEGYREKYGDIQRLDRILEAEGDTPNRYKASKQADVLMLFYLFSADEVTQIFEQLGYDFDRKSIPRQIDYYLDRTSHGSTLSWVVHAWVLARSNRRRSWRLFQCALDSDIADIQGGTTREGIHLGAMAGTVDLLQRGYVGIETRGGILHFNPALPDELSRLCATVRYRGHTLDVEVHPETLRVASRTATAEPVTIAYRGRFRAMSPGTTHEFRLVRHGEREAERREAKAEEQIRQAPAERVREEEPAQ